jgi:hypothetical protein
LTPEDEDWSVVHVMVADTDVTLDATAEMTGDAVVVNVELPDVLDTEEPFADTTSKSYMVPGVRPLIVTE